MKSIYLSLILFLSVTVCFGQEEKYDPIPDENVVFDKVEVDAKFTKGNPLSYISQFIEYTNKAIENKIEGRILVKFTVEKDGTVSDVRVASEKLGYGLDEMVVKAVSKTSGLWKPATIDGNPVRANFRLPVTFRLPPDEEETCDCRCISVSDTIVLKSETLVKKEIGNKYGYMDKTGKEVIPAIYDRICPFSEDLAAAKKEDKWGFIDIDGKERISFIYDSADDFKEERARVSKKGKWYMINRKGKKLKR